MRVLLLEGARRDLIAIRRYISKESPGGAARVAARLGPAIDSLAATPHLGRPGRWPGTRELVVTGTWYIMAYRVRAGTIEILRVLHTRRPWPDPPT